jgi:hypothetical protein
LARQQADAEVSLISFSAAPDGTIWCPTLSYAIGITIQEHFYLPHLPLKSKTYAEQRASKEAFFMSRRVAKQLHRIAMSLRGFP